MKEYVNDLNKTNQHFLIDENVINQIIKIANILPTDEVIEIGSGNGVLTDLIASQAKKIIGIEIDEGLKPQLEKISHRHQNIELIFNNVLNTYLPRCDKIITSLPYNIVEPFINKLLKCQFKELYMIVGNKYVEGVIKKETTKLAILTNCFFRLTKYFEILPTSFNSPPRVKSALIKLEQ